jgi:hypothetical protein
VVTLRERLSAKLLLLIAILLSIAGAIWAVIPTWMAISLASRVVSSPILVVGLSACLVPIILIYGLCISAKRFWLTTAQGVSVCCPWSPPLLSSSRQISLVLV